MSTESNGISAISLDDLAALAALIPKPIPWSEFKAEVMPALTRPTVRKSTEARNLRVIHNLDAMGVETTANLDLALVVRYIKDHSPSWKPITLKGHLLVISKLCKMAVERRRLVVSPFASVSIRRLVGPIPKPSGKRHLTKDECRRLLSLLRQDIEARKGWSQWKARRLHAVACIGLYCGLRKNELLRLHVADIDFRARVIRLTPHNADGKFKTEASEKPVPMPSALIHILQDWLAHRLDHPAGMTIDKDCPWLIPTCNRKAPWTSGAPGGKAPDRLKDAARRAGIDHITMQMMRRSCATHLKALRRADDGLATRVLRHTNEKTTEAHYICPDEQNLADAVADFDF
jgi:integrase